MSNLQSLFYPKSIAVVGASERLGGGKLPYFHILKRSGFAGDLYAVNPKQEPVDGQPAYPSLEALPEGIDLAIVTAPMNQALGIVRSAVRKKVKFLHFFTSGFAEAGNRALEEEMVREARRGGVRIVGPNGLGVYCPEAGLSFGPPIEDSRPGPVAFLGQSGGITGNFMAQAASKRIPLNKVVSYGNQIDLTVEDFLEYFQQDPTIRWIAAYIEDVKDGRRFLQILRQTAAEKTVILLKGGRTEKGARAAESHTGALAGNDLIWSSAVRQAGAILVDDFDQMMHLVMLAGGRKAPAGKRLGFLGAGGGVSVLFTDFAIRAGLQVPELEKKTQDRIQQRIAGVNTSTLNPVDLGAFGFDLGVMLHTMRAMDRDAHVDVILPYFSVEYMMRSEILLQVKNSEQTFQAMAREIEKPVIPVLIRFTEDNLDMERLRIAAFQALRQAGFPVYEKLQDAVYAIATYQKWVNQKKTNP